MFFKKLFYYKLLILFFFAKAIATETNLLDDEPLVIGCRPWDANVQAVKGLNNAHFVDFIDRGIPESKPTKFYHLDVNDTGLNSAGSFTSFTKDHKARFKTIIIDWMTYHHFRRSEAWKDFADLLTKDGNLFIPITKVNFSGISLSEQTAQNLMKNCNFENLFSSVDIIQYKNLSLYTDTGLDLLQSHRLGLNDVAQSMTPAIIVAKK